MDLNALKTKRTDLLQQRTAALETATKKYEAGDMAAYNTAMDTVKGFNGQLDELNRLIGETEKTFGGEFAPAASDFKGMAAGNTLLDTIRGTQKYADAWLTAMRKGINPDKGVGIQELAPLYEAEKALKALTIGGGETPGEDGGFLVPVDFDNMVQELMKEYVDLSELVNVENVKVNSGWRVVDASGVRTALTKLGEMGKINPGKQPSYKRVTYTCEKYGDKIIVSNELMADAKGLMAYLAKWWAPKYVQTKNALILEQLNALDFSALDGATDTEQIKDLKHLINTGLNTAHSKRATILTNSFAYDRMDNWVDGNGRALLQPDVKNPDVEKFKGRRVVYADADLIPAVEQDGTAYDPMYVGNLKAFCSLFVRQGTRIRSTDIGGDAWDTDSTEIRCTCRLDCVTVDADAVKFTGIPNADAAAAAVSDEEEQV